MIKYLTLFAIFLPFYSYSNQILPIPAEFLNIIGKIESNNNDFAVGDGGKAISRYQIHKICFIDAQKFDKTLANIEYFQITNEFLANKVFTAYLNKYGQNEIRERNFEALARLWNSGPLWKSKKNKTEKYWNRVKNELNK